MTKITLFLNGDQERLLFQSLHAKKPSLEEKQHGKSTLHQEMIRNEIRLINQILIQVMGVNPHQPDPMLL
ncbi:hypothetical protein SAMN05444392_106115 [Seinonella peptonophila]|uniref:Uncharacterized protein n=1 Tax=Seinonella peptonophila TaxID=112248 RepID=A0A1M4Y8X6_9BACL|nr:hypothetical protein [Seinonella peptonophila]SHF02267.1 hypothetical protein SAMN05444392_106115 [Seinonella peptonophila]